MSHRYKLSMRGAVDLQEWALKESKAEKFLKDLPEIQNKAAPGIYVDYKIDKSELDGGIDYPDVGVATIYAVFEKGGVESLGEIRAYNWEVVWLSTTEYDEVDNVDDWWKFINEDYQKLKNSRGESTR